jgi:Cu+-exporting ATPase
MATDPVCGMEVDEKNSEFSTTYGGKDFYFCSEECENKFDENPSQYATANAA